MSEELDALREWTLAYPESDPDNSIENLWARYGAEFAAAMKKTRAALARPSSAGEKEKPKLLYRHKKRGTMYHYLGEASLQAEHAQHEGAVLVVYKGDKDGRLWVRPVYEFQDGRFEQVWGDYLMPTPEPSTGERWKLVPVEPTEKMKAAGGFYFIQGAGAVSESDKNAAAKTYRAMLADAPEPPASEKRVMTDQEFQDFWGKGINPKADAPESSTGEKPGTRNDNLLREAAGHLGVALVQSATTDDQIIIGHIRAAKDLITKAMEKAS